MTIDPGSDWTTGRWEIWSGDVKVADFTDGTVVREFFDPYNPYAEENDDAGEWLEHITR